MDSNFGAREMDHPPGSLVLQKRQLSFLATESFSVKLEGRLQATVLSKGSERTWLTAPQDHMNTGRAAFPQPALCVVADCGRVLFTVRCHREV